MRFSDVCEISYNKPVALSLRATVNLIVFLCERCMLTRAYFEIKGSLNFCLPDTSYSGRFVFSPGAVSEKLASMFINAKK